MMETLVKLQMKKRISFDFDFGCLGGTFTNIDGEAHLDCLQWYDDSEDDEPEVIDINTNNI